jgi:hypothetical protein
MVFSLQVVTLDVFVFAGCNLGQKHQRLQPVITKTSKVTTCKDKNINGYNLQRQKHQRLQPANTKTSRVTTCTDKNIKGYNL